MTPIDPVNAVQLGTLMKVVGAMHGVPVERMPAVKGRFRNFLKLGLPDVRAVGTGSRAEYWPGHVAQVLVAFELVRFRMPQTAAAYCVGRCADVVEAAVGDAARWLTGESAEGSRTTLLVSSDALLEDAKRPGFGDMSMTRVAGIGEITATRGAILAIDTVPLVKGAARAASSTDEPFTERFFTTLGHVQEARAPK